MIPALSSPEEGAWGWPFCWDGRRLWWVLLLLRWWCVRDPSFKGLGWDGGGGCGGFCDPWKRA